MTQHELAIREVLGEGVTASPPTVAGWIEKADELLARHPLAEPLDLATARGATHYEVGSWSLTHRYVHVYRPAGPCRLYDGTAGVYWTPDQGWRITDFLAVEEWPNGLEEIYGRGTSAPDHYELEEV